MFSITYTMSMGYRGLIPIWVNPDLEIGHCCKLPFNVGLFSHSEWKSDVRPGHNDAIQDGRKYRHYCYLTQFSTWIQEQCSMEFDWPISGHHHGPVDLGHPKTAFPPSSPTSSSANEFIQLYTQLSQWYVDAYRNFQCCHNLCNNLY